MIRSDRNISRQLGSTICIVLLTLAAMSLSAGGARAQSVPDSCPDELADPELVRHDFDQSSCVLCGQGTVQIVVENPFLESQNLGFSNIHVIEDLGISDLVYVRGSTRFRGSNIDVPDEVEPDFSGPNNSVLTWKIPAPFTMDARSNSGSAPAILIVEFKVEHRGPRVEELVDSIRDIEAGLAISPSCAPGERFETTGGAGELDLDQPVVRIDKRGRNLDAGQSGYSNTVYGHEDDDVIWRIRVYNDGDAPLEDLEFTDIMDSGSFVFDYLCDRESHALAASGGNPPSRCVELNGATEVEDFDVADAFGDGDNPYIVADPGERRSFYIVGRVTNSCVDKKNSVEDVEWGCQIQRGPGGIAENPNGSRPDDDEWLRTKSVESRLQVNVALTGANTGQPTGTRGTVTITIDNDTRGTIMGGVGGIHLRNALPDDYVVDTTFAPTLLVQPAYGSPYEGMIDTLEWINPEPGTVPPPGAMDNSAAMLENKAPEFLLTSSSSNEDFPEQFDMLRHGDVAVVTFRTVLIDPQYYDRVANLDVRTETPGGTPSGTDPAESFQIDNRLDVDYEEFCNGTRHGAQSGSDHELGFDQTSTARPEDLDVNMDGAELLFILTSTGDSLPLTVELTNNGGHDASDYQAWVTFGMAMTVQNAPQGCTPMNIPPDPEPPVWKIPDTLPDTGAVYVCERGAVGPGITESLTFDVVKNTAQDFDDDLTFRADVIGEIRLSDGTPLWFPPPAERPDEILDPANNYSVDGVRARVVGYDLLKRQLGVCSENNPPPGDPDSLIQIGEQCSYHVESGGWFGFETPGFTYIAVQKIQVVDENPDGQGFISSTNPMDQSTSAIKSVLLNPPPEPLAEAPFDWTFNQNPDTERITELDHWFRVDFTTRLLNDPIDTSASPNQHSAPSINTLTSTFEAIFYNDVKKEEEIFDLGPDTIGFPKEVYRRVDLTVTEPTLIVTKDVCNETRYGAGAACSNFVPLADDGDAFDTYVYRVTVENEASNNDVPRAPAYDVTVTSVADASDLLFVDTLAGDTLDNDGDTLVDGADAAGEGQIVDNTPLNGAPAEIIASYTHSDALLRIDAGERVVLYYRVDPNDDAAPLQRMTNTVTASYDANGEIGGARRYESEPAEASIQIIPVEVSPKQVVRAANSPLVTSNNSQPASIGEELEFELHALIPVAQLRSFAIRDELPEGLSCAEAPVVDLGAAPYADAGFLPGGVFTPVCSADEVEWNFGNQTVTRSPRADRRFDFAIRFIGRIDNTLANQDGVVLRNGGSSTVTTVSYVDERGGAVVIPIGEASAVVLEPVIELGKAFSVAEADAGDRPRVTVTATNTGNAPAYNLRVLDDLSALPFDYAGDIAGTSPPTADITTFGASAPLFTWAPGTGIAPGETVSFSFAVQVDGLAEPLEVLPNTIQACPRSATPSTTTRPKQPHRSASRPSASTRWTSIPRWRRRSAPTNPSRW
ncbi:MAG: DUF11 domain-containing protein [Deltaproteobacteria bacterium]|nr:DUF11 domain-containing protein [Deltaproteobacteria bacterium]